MKERLQGVIWWLDDLTDWASRIGEIFCIAQPIAVFVLTILSIRMFI